jgi:sulfoxide reductase catalytic subunit YedY
MSVLARRWFADMLIKKPSDIKSSEITPLATYLNRRTFLQGAGLAAGAIGTGALYKYLNPPPPPPLPAEPIAEVARPAANAADGFQVDEPLTSKRDITNYNNFYEFSTSKEGVAAASRGFVTKPWTVEVNGMAHKPKTFGFEELLKLAPQEERVYRFRCVEAWSMVIPWVGFPLAKLLAAVEPLGQAKYVAFQTLHDEERMPNQRRSVLDWPYVEGLRLDEAMHPLTILATGLYGERLLPQNGAPIRLVVPWKYGFKSIKSIVRITLTDTEPATTWNLAAPDEYGFYSNVNPQVSHPRWSQATERRIGQFSSRETLMFNGYADQVAQMYAGLDLRRNF